MNLFTSGDATDLWYRNLRDSPNPRSMGCRALCESLWADYEPHADNHFLVEIRRDFHARFWEMYLAVTMLRLGYEIQCPKPGPDVGILFEGRRIWFEATAPKPGADNSPDRVPDMVMGQVNWVPNEQIVLRYLSAIREKLATQYPRWIERGVVTPQDAFVVAINPKLIGHEIVDTIPPRILQAAFPIGAPSVTLDGRTGEKLGEGYQYRISIEKASGAKVPTAAFLDAANSALSGLLCSRVDAGNQPVQLGENFQLVPNPMATTLLPAAFRLPGTYYPVTRERDVLTVQML
jgi:hypothetical protein